MESDNGVVRVESVSPDVVGEEREGWDDWITEDGDLELDDSSEFQFVCLFCHLMYSSCTVLFEHCSSSHYFDFHHIRKALDLDFYGSLKLINYVRQQVAQNRCWNCYVLLESHHDLLDHLHEAVLPKKASLPWDDDNYLKPFRLGDSLLYSLDFSNEEEDLGCGNIDVEKKTIDIPNDIFMDVKKDEVVNAFDIFPIKGVRDTPLGVSNGTLGGAFWSSDKNVASVIDSKGGKVPLGTILEESPYVLAKNIRSIDGNYFAAYSSFGIHREMLGDKVRMDAYKHAILKNPSLFRGANVMDVGCGTGILSLFAAQAGACRVIAVEASSRMAGIAVEIAKDNGCLWSCGGGGVIQVVSSMVEDLDLEPGTIDVIVSEWMGYCLFYESMLCSVLHARDKWLRPGGAILPDAASILVAGFGRGGTSIPFWEDVHGFSMSCIGREVMGDAAATPLVDFVSSEDLVTNTALLQSFDLTAMAMDEVDFTATVELQPRAGHPTPVLCYGLLLWFETAFSSRFCREASVLLSTSPYGPRTHWAQTILTFREPIPLLATSDEATAPAASQVHARVSIARAVTDHRGIDISLEITAVSTRGHKRAWPPQLFLLS